jgi:hypothetical protein
MVFGPLSWIVMPDLIRHPGFWELREAWIPDLPSVVRNDERSMKPMKKNSKDETSDELRPEYDLANLLKEGVRGKCSKRFDQGTNLVLLSPDIAKAFPTDEAVNEALRKETW